MQQRNSNPSPARLLTLAQALERISSSRRTYFRTRTILPPAIRRGGRLFFVEAEIEEHILRLVEARDGGIRQDT